MHPCNKAVYYDFVCLSVCMCFQLSTDFSCLMNTYIDTNTDDDMPQLKFVLLFCCHDFQVTTSLCILFYKDMILCPGYN